jgi:hypothetical protein
MRYPGNISGEEYAAMEEGYEQGRAEANRGLDTRALRGLTSAGGVALVVDGIAYVKQDDLIAAIDQMDRSNR